MGTGNLKRFFLRWAGWVVVCFVLVPQMGAASERTPTVRIKACCANLRVISGAIEMYNMDNDNKMTDVDLTILSSPEAGYLKGIPKCPDGGQYLPQGDMTTDGVPKCTIHGTVVEATEFINRQRKREELRVYLMAALIGGGFLTFFVVRKIWVSDSGKRTEE